MNKDQYYYLKTINNNAITALDKNKHEVLLMGKGIGIKCDRTLYSRIDDKLIERVFVPKNNVSYFESLLAEIPYPYYSIVEKAIQIASEQLHYDFHDSLYVTLLDHIYFSKKLLDEGEVIKNPLLSETKLIHRQEFQVAMNMVDYLNEQFNINFDQNEASYIAFHLVNAMTNLTQSNNKKLMQILEETINFISTIETIQLDEQSYYYGRLISHIKYFLIRKFEKENVNEKEVVTNEIIDSIIKTHPYEWMLAKKIQQFFINQYGFKVSEQETAYLTMHIVPLIMKGDKNE